MGRFTQSGRRNACPICGRTKDDDCRWNDEVILCHTGTDLKPGATVTVGDKEWAFIHHKGGFSGMAAVFHPHRPLERAATKPRRIIRTKRDQINEAQWAEVLRQFHAAADETWNTPEFCSCNPEQLEKVAAVINNAQRKATLLARDIRQVWRDFPALEQQHRLQTESELRDIAQLSEQLRQFKLQELGLPRLAAVDRPKEHVA